MLPKGAQHIFGRWLGVFFWTFVPKKRKELAVRQILECKITSDRNEAERIAKESVLRFGPMMVEVLTFPQYTMETLDRKITFVGRKKLEDALAVGKGGILAASHCGNWELLGATLASYGYPLISVAQKQNDAGADKFIKEYRQMMKQKVTYKTGVRDMLRLMDEGAMIGLLMDQDPGFTGIVAELFGRPTLTATGPAAMARMKGTPILPIFIYSDSPYHHTIVIHEAIYCDHTKDKKEDILVTTNRLNAVLASHIQEHPEEWFWLHNRWKWTQRYFEKNK